ncbi:MAG: UDP-N-acetylmuramoyl-L-alanine--D-glutamate ligase [Candidatus Coatesbacteria bacterium]|nr:UDP-N-acetylmuramoyl-L-alanine--D-glutamate ligase [Candidatus Coatesbacteria bacterium]
MRFNGDFHGMRVVVFGLGASGRAASLTLSHLGAAVTVVDQGDNQTLQERAAALRAVGIATHLGDAPSETMCAAEMVVVSPGIPVEIDPLSKARAAGACIIGELELSYMISDAEFLAITGTKGKSTTTRLLHRMLSTAGFETIMGGNLPNEPLCDKVLTLPATAKVVAEVSSFQLETVRTFCPHIACITNLDIDHLDRHPSLDEYYAAKLRIFENQRAGDILVVNGGDAKLLELTQARASSRILFGAVNPGGVNGVFLQEGQIVLAADGRTTALFNRSDIPLAGLHNVENVTAATAMAINAGASAESIKEALEGFELAPHTLELFAEFRGIRFVDDSHATNALSVSKAICAFDAPVILIAGGKDKGCNYRDFFKGDKGSVKTVIAIGEAASKIESALEDELTVLVTRGGIDEIVAMAIDLAESGDVVLLSPGCSSFDMFADFRDRGNSFKRAVHEYFEAEGESIEDTE